MKKLVLSFPVFLCSALNCFSQNVIPVCIKPSVASVTSINPANIGSNVKNSIELYYNEPYLMFVNQTVGAGAVWKINKTYSYLLISNNINAPVHEKTIRTACAMQLSSKLKTGIAFNYYHLSYGTDYPKNRYFNVSAGIMYSITKATEVGLFSKNSIVQKKAISENASFENGFCINHRASENFMAGLEVLISPLFGSRIKVGAEYVHLNKIFIRGGIKTNPVTPYLGMGYSIVEKCSLFITGESHFQLGLSNSIQIIYSLK